jgi:hypothetical protein
MSEKLKFGRGLSFSRATLKRLRQTGDVWQADFRPFPEAGRKRRHPCWLGIVLSQTDDLVLGDLVLGAPPTVNDLARLLADAMRRPLIEAARRPTRIVLRDNPVWHELLPHLRELKIEVVLQGDLPEWDSMLADFARGQKASG